MVKLTPINEIAPAVYNPRRTDPQRLEWVKLSLRKLGWLHPIYATPAGEILSGHQRKLSAEQLGYTHVPVVYFEAKAKHQKYGLNLLFNRGTNDMRGDTTSEEAARELLESGLLDKAAALPDHDTSVIPCMNLTRVSVPELMRLNDDKFNRYARNVAEQLKAGGIIMPIIITPDNRVVNGIGRLQYYATKGVPSIPAVTIPSELADVAGGLLNLLSMDFTLEDEYADILRHNAFRREEGVRKYLGAAYLFATHGNKPGFDFDIRDPAVKAKWVAEHGDVVADFGAGLMDEARLLRSVGIKVSAFEPFTLKRGVPDRDATAAVAEAFLKDVADGVEFTSIFNSHVMNSVPFKQDRLHIVQILAALAGPQTTLYAVAASNKNIRAVQIEKEMVGKGSAKSRAFKLDYEDKVSIQDLLDAPKVQKFHTPSEFHELFSTGFESVQTKYLGSLLVQATCRKPKTPTGLRAALEFEFNVAYPDGRRLGLVNEAVAAFKKRGYKL